MKRASLKRVRGAAPKSFGPLERSLVGNLHQILPSGSRFLVAVSGGKDSVALLELLIQLGDIRKYELLVAHVDHALRATSKRDAQFVKKLCKKHGLGYFSKRLRPTKNRGNIEAWARTQRYQFLEDIRRKSRSNWIVTAHHQGDLVETLLIRLLQNRELGTMSPVDQARKIARPLLMIPQQTLLGYLSQKKLRWVEDETNCSDAFLRNRIRTEVLPVLEKVLGSDPRAMLSERAASLNGDLNALRWLAQSLAAEVSQETFGSKEWIASSRLILSMVPESVGWRIAEQLLSQTGRPRMEKRVSLGERHGRKVAAFILSNSQLELELPGGNVLFRKTGQLKLIKRVKSRGSSR